MRLIDTNALIGELHNTYLYDSDARTVIYKKIDEQPTVDAVHVVRCRDCRYMDDTVKNFEWDGTCNFGGKQESTMYNRFCSDGDRRKAKPTTINEVTE